MIATATLLWTIRVGAIYSATYKSQSLNHIRNKIIKLAGRKKENWITKSVGISKLIKI